MSEMPAGSITMGDLYQAIMAMKTDLTKTLSKLEVIESRNGDADRIHADHETRLRTLESTVPTSLEGRIMALEKFRWQVVGALIAINALAVIVEWLIWSPRK